MWPLMGQRIGTHYYDNFPNMLDQFLVSKGLLDDNASITLKPNSAEIIRHPDMTSTDEYESPIRFGRPSKTVNTSGFSDHYPISVVLQEN
jgi:hypothetical protein